MNRLHKSIYGESCENMKKIVLIKIIVLAIVICLFICLLNIRGSHENFTLNVEKNEYQITLYNNRGEKIFSETYPVEPGITEIGKDILAISISTGSPSRYEYYFDKKNSKISRTFFNPIIWGNVNIAYMEDNHILILTDMFDQGIISKQIQRDFTETADPISAIISIKAIDEKNIELKYYSGPNYTPKEELINYID